MIRACSLVVAIALAIGALAGAPVSRAAVDTIYLGDAVHSGGGSCADPDFSSAGGFSAAMMAALAAIDADGDTLVICNGDYTLTDEVVYDSEHSFTVRAESRRKVTIGGTTIFMSGCSPAVTVVGMHFDEIGEGFFCGEEDMILTVLDSEFSGGGAVAWLNGPDDVYGRLRIVDSHIHHMTEIAIAYASSIELYNSVYEQNVSVIGLYAPFNLELKRSRLDYNLGQLISVGATSCLTVERSTLTANGQPNDMVPEFEPGFMSAATLWTGSNIDLSCDSNVSNSRFKDNVAALGGALVFVEPSGATVVKNNLFSGNRGLIAGAVGLCSNAPSRQMQTLARRVGNFKVNRYRGNEAVDRRANNVFLLTTTGDFADWCVTWEIFGG